MNKIFQEHFLDNPAFWLVATLKSITKMFEKQLQKNPIFKVGDSESTSKILEKHLQRNLHFRNLVSIYEQDLWNTPVKDFFLSLLYCCSSGYICDCSQCITLKMFDISFSKPASTNSMILCNVVQIDWFTLKLYLERYYFDDLLLEVWLLT